MSKIQNFSAGPSILAESAFEKSIQDIRNFAGTGLSILEVSHRGKEFEKVMADAAQLVRDLLSVPDNYDVMFLQGGASTQFFQIPLNFLRTKAAYTQTGTWASRAIIEAQGYGQTEVLASSKSANRIRNALQAFLPCFIMRFSEHARKSSPEKGNILK